MRKTFGFSLAVLLIASSLQAQTQRLPGMRFPGQVTRDARGIATVQALTHHDLFFLQGYTEAQDRFFQMDTLRKTASGRLAELVGKPALPTDVQLRTIGLRRAAEWSLQEASPRARQALEAYAAGVNAWLASNPLPAEYAPLEISVVEPWTPLDSVAIGKLITFTFSFRTDDIDRTVALLTYQEAGRIIGFNGHALFFEDLFRSAPAIPAVTVPDAGGASARTPEVSNADTSGFSADWIDPATADLARAFIANVEAAPQLRDLLGKDQTKGSNQWAIAGRLSTTGNAMMANDPHVSLENPSLFYPVSLRAPRLSASGHSIAGVPFVMLGQNERIAWGAVVNRLDVTDFFQEKIVRDPAAPAGLSIEYQGENEWLFPILQTFRMNRVGSGTADDIVDVPAGNGIPPATLIVPRRNAPIISLDVASGRAISVQYTGLYPTREMDAFYSMNEARNTEEFRDALQYYDVGSMGWSYTDVDGNIAYFTSGEMPLRADLQGGSVSGLPPSFIRDGSSGANDWIRQHDVPENQATFAQILPFSEMPQVVNPSAGWFVNANNDPIGNTLDNNPMNQLRPGGGLFYLDVEYNAGFRAGRITEMIRERVDGGGRLSPDDMKRIQADVVMLDARFFTPHIVEAFSNSRAAGAHPMLAALGSSPAIAGAVARLSQWDHSTPTGIVEGYDWTDPNGDRVEPTEEEIANSVAATIYSVWRGQILKNTIDGVLGAGDLPRPRSQQVMTALQNLFANFEQRQGRGASGVNFFNVQGVEDAAARRDVIILKSLADSLELITSEEFAPAFNRSTDMNDWRWGRLHRLVLAHRLGGPLNVPPAAGAFPPPIPQLPGIPVDGGFEVVDAASHDPRAASLNGFMFSHGPGLRYVGEARTSGIAGETSTPGGPSGVPGHPHSVNLLPLWLTNDYYPLITQPAPRLPWIGR